MKIYYAHPLYIYNTPQEQRDMDLLNTVFPSHTIINPNNPEADALYKETWSMDVFFELVRDCDLLVFRATPSGQITAGVAAEIREAINCGISVLEIPSMVNSRSMNVEQTREYLKEIGQR